MTLSGILRKDPEVLEMLVQQTLTWKGMLLNKHNYLTK